MKLAVIAALLVTIAPVATSHQLDEYLQKTIFSVDKHQLHAQMTLTPGVAIFPMLAAQIDMDRDGRISEAEQHAYAARVLRDLSVTIDGERLRPRVVLMHFPSMADMKEGGGEIQLDFEAQLPPGGRNRKLSLNNRHESRISAYQVNCLVPSDPQIRIASQHRNYSQSAYELEFEDSGFRVESFVPGRLLWFGPVVLLLVARFIFLCWRKYHQLTVTMGR